MYALTIKADKTISMHLPELTDAIKALGSHLGEIRKSIHEGWGMLDEVPWNVRQAMSPRSRANLVHDLIVDRASRRLPAEIVDLSDLKLFVFDGKAALRFKKFGDDYISRNQPTKQVERFRAQEQMPGFPPFMNLEAGYILDRYTSEITSTHLVCPNGKGVYWELGLDETHAVEGVSDLFEERRHEEEELEPSIWTPKTQNEIIAIRKKDEQDT